MLTDLRIKFLRFFRKNKIIIFIVNVNSATIYETKWYI